MYFYNFELFRSFISEFCEVPLTICLLSVSIIFFFFFIILLSHRVHAFSCCFFTFAYLFCTNKLFLFKMLLYIFCHFFILLSLFLFYSLIFPFIYYSNELLFQIFGKGCCGEPQNKSYKFYYLY